MKTGHLFQWTCIDRVGSACIYFACMVILARFVSPEDFGAVGALALFISLGNMLVDSGMGGALIKKQDATKVDYGTLFVYNGVCSVLLCGILWLGSPLLNWFFRNEALGGILKVLSLVLILNAVSIVQYVKLVKNLEMKKICVVSIVSGLLACIGSSVMAVYGCGAWACVAFFILQAFFRSAGYYLAVWDWPEIVFSFQSFKQQFRFGGYLLGSNIMNVTSNHLSSFAIGRFFPIAVLGYYYQAHRLYTSNSELLVAVIDRVAFPVLCKSPDKEEMVRSSHNIFKPVFTLLYPAFAVGIVIAEKFVILVLGEQWQTAGQYFAILLIALFPGLVKVMLRNVLKSAGNTRAIFLTEMLTAIIMLTLICVAIRISILALVGSFAVGMFCSMLIYAKFSYADKMVNFRDIGKITFVPLCAAVIAGVTTWGTLLLCGDYFYSVVSLGIVFVAGFAASFVFYLAVGNVYCLQILNYGKRAFFSKFCKS